MAWPAPRGSPSPERAHPEPRLYQATWSLALAINPVMLLPLHARLGEAVFWALLGLIAAPAALLLLHLDRDADRPERLRGLSEAPGRDPTFLSAIAPEG